MSRFIRAFFRRIAGPMLIVAFTAYMSVADTGKPNFVFVIADDCTFRDIGCYGGQAHTPHIDQLAREGMRMTHCFQAAPMCSPTRHNIYTGLYPAKSGAYPNHTFARPGTKSVVHYLEPLGYRVALSGKRHVAPQEVFPFVYLPGGKNPDFGAIDGFLTECREAETPFCLFVCSNEPHSPWDQGDVSRYDPDTLVLPDHFVDTPVTRTKMAHYLAEVTYFDGQVGACLKLLGHHALLEDTLVLVVSEQGSSFPFGKWTCYDTGLQSACVARWPGKIAPGGVSHAMIEYVDVLPTFIDLAGGVAPAVLDGKSFGPVLLGNTSEHKKFVFGEMTTRGIHHGSEHFGIRSVRSRQYKYIWNFTPEVEFQNACTNSTLFRSWLKQAEVDASAAEKVRRYTHRPGEELYDVSRDPLEWHNLANSGQHAEIKAKLRAELLAWMASTGDQGQQAELDALLHQGKARRKKER